jgi:hypothetical protein
VHHRPADHGPDTTLLRMDEFRFSTTRRGNRSNDARH